MLKLNPSKRCHPPETWLFFERMKKPSQHREKRFRFRENSDVNDGGVVGLDVAGIRWMCHYSSISYLFLYILCITCRQTVAWCEISETGRLFLCGDEDECWVLCIHLVFCCLPSWFRVSMGWCRRNICIVESMVSFQIWWKMNIARCLLFLDKSVQSANFLDLYVFFQEVAASAQAGQSFRF